MGDKDNINYKCVITSRGVVVSNNIKKTKKHAGGRPTKYDPAYCESIISFFSADPIIYKDITITHKDGSTIDKTEMEAAPTPFLTAWCKSIGINIDTVHEWARKYPQFSVAYKRAKQLQREFVVETALKGVHNGNFSIFMMKNVCKWQDKEDPAWTDPQEVNHSGEMNVTHKTFWADLLKRAKETPIRE